MTRRRWYVAAGAVLFLVAVVAIGNDRDSPLDPDGTGPNGAKALVLLLDSFARDVQVVETTPLPAVDTAVLLDDRLSDAARAEVRRWVIEGGTLVVADPDSPFVPAANDIEIGSVGALSMEPGHCTVQALSVVGDVEVSGRVGYPVGPGARSCFGDDGSAFVVVTDLGEGTLVAVGGAGVWINATLDAADNAVLAVALLAPGPNTDVAFLRRRLTVPVDEVIAGDEPAEVTERRDDVGDGGTGLFDLMPDSLRWVVVQLALGWLVYAIARARRLGRPVVEPQPVEIPGSEIVRATGRLLRMPPARETAALLTESLRLDLAAHLGLPHQASPALVAEVASPRSDMSTAEIEDALLAPAVADDADLVELASRLDRIREEVTSVRATRHE